MTSVLLGGFDGRECIILKKSQDCERSIGPGYIEPKTDPRNQLLQSGRPVPRRRTIPAECDQAPD